MSEAAITSPEGAVPGDRVPGWRLPFRRAGELLRQTEVDLRLFGMVAALIVIWLGFGIASGGRILTPISMLNLTVQVVPVAIIATGMVLLIVSRNIDLSVGSVTGVVSMSVAILFFKVFPGTIGVDSSFGWLIALLVGIAVGGLIGAFHGFLIAYIGIPSFIVTLGGLLAWRGAIWVIGNGQTVAPDDKFFVTLLAGGPEGSIGGPASWVVGVVLVAGLVLVLVNSRRQRRRFGFPVRPRWAEFALGGLGAVAILGFVAIANAYKWPQGIVDRRLAVDPNFVVPPGGVESGIPNPLLVLLGVTLVVTFIARRLRFGRAVYALGGNPEAAELAGINTRWTVMKTFILIGLLTGIAGAIASAKLNGATLDIGDGYELLVIAAAVIGGTSLVGGIGTVPGAIVGALVMESLRYGLSFLGHSTPIQNLVGGAVLVAAVGLDSWNRRRAQ